MIKLNFKKIHPRVKKPTYGTEGAGGFDFYTPEDVRFRPFERKQLELGIALEIPEGYTVELIARSSMGMKTPLRIVNGKNLIDCDYRGEIKPYIENILGSEWILEEGTRIVQGVLRKYEKARFKEVKELSETERGDGGYGSTGK